MPKGIFVERAARAVPIEVIAPARFNDWKKGADKAARAWAEATGFTASSGAISVMAGADGSIARVLLGADPAARYAPFAAAASQLPAGPYRIKGRLSTQAANDAALGWALARYRFNTYKPATEQVAAPVLVWPPGCARDEILRAADAIYLTRDLINTPAADMGPDKLAAAARRIARAHKASIAVTTGEQLLRRNYPLIHAVGRASATAPRLIDLRWGPARAPKLTLVGKGVCFDSGGLDLKSASGMLRMKKDMGGAAHALALAQMVMQAGLKLRLRVLVPAVENAVAGNAIRPLDVVKSRAGITVEIGNTDAEGRLVMCDALTEAVSEKPELLMDFATLTGAARVALGNDLPALFCNDDALAADFARAGEDAADPIWRLPLWRPYRRMLDSDIADINNVGTGGVAGAITAALYLQEFVPDDTRWAHLDLMGWNVAARPGHPAGGEAMGLRAAFGVIASRFGAGR